MFGLEFLFGWGLLALPLAGLPVLLHLLFRRKSPIVHFSTLRFIKSSVQHTAARKKVQRWLLLAVRMLLLGLLIWAIAQPAKKLAGGWLGASTNSAAAIVVDTSYSMDVTDQNLPLLARVDDTVQTLLRDQLRDAKVAIIRSAEPAQGQAETLQSSSSILGQWTPLKPEAGREPLAQRVARAVDMLRRDGSDSKWLVILTDTQAREFPTPMPQVDDMRVVFMDLHPPEVHNVGITGIWTEPQQPIPGVGSQVVVEVTGKANETRAVTVGLAKADGTSIWNSAAQMANLDAKGRTQIRFPVQFPPDRWVQVKAALGSDDAMAWDNTRTELIEIPPRQNVTILQPAEPRNVHRIVKLALDPSEGKLAAWPVNVSTNLNLTGDENVAVAPLTVWPDDAMATRMRDFVRGGGTLVVMLQPGIEESWEQASAGTKSAMTELLPSAPSKSMISGAYQALPAGTDPLIKGLSDEQFQLNSISVRRLVAFGVNESSATAILNVTPTKPTPGARNHGLIFRKKLGQGTAYTVATLPESRYSNLGVHPTFLPMLVRMSLRPTPQNGLNQQRKLLRMI